MSYIPRVGDRVEAGQHRMEYDRGTVLEILGDTALVGWDSGVRCWEDRKALRPEGSDLGGLVAHYAEQLREDFDPPAAGHEVYDAALDWFGYARRDSIEREAFETALDAYLKEVGL